jgi:hypothetical protein
MHRDRTVRRTAVAFVFGMAALSVTGCSPVSSPPSSSPTTPRSTTSSTQSGLPVGCGQPNLSGGGPSTSSISAIQFVSPEVGWAVGSTIWATTDAGTTWRSQSPPAVNCSSVDALNADDVWALGVEYPSFVATSDGGKHWVSLPEPGSTLDSVHFISPTVGFAVAGGTAAAGGDPQCGGVLLETGDGGRTWRQLPSPPNVQSACFSDSSDGWLSASVAAHADVFHSSHGGASWRREFMPPLTRMALEAGYSGAALAQLQCANGAVWAL